jgi:hypothetical protein
MSKTTGNITGNIIEYIYNNDPILYRNIRNEFEYMKERNILTSILSESSQCESDFNDYFNFNIKEHFKNNSTLNNKIYEIFEKFEVEDFKEDDKILNDIMKKKKKKIDDEEKKLIRETDIKRRDLNIEINKIKELQDIKKKRIEEEDNINNTN